MALLAVLVGVGMAYEASASRGDAQRYTPPGRLLEVGGRSVHLYCTGRGEPTVVLEAGLGEQSMTWASVQQVVARSTRVCSYDRSGYGWSEARPDAGNYRDAAKDLHSLLERSGERGPYVMVGHSVGGTIARLFTNLYPREVSGLVLVDPTEEDAVIEAGKWGVCLQSLQNRTFAILGRVGIVRLLGPSLVKWAADAEPPPEVIARVPVLYGPKSQAAAVRELEGAVESARLVRAIRRPGAWGDIPVAVISAGRQPAAIISHHALLADLSASGRHVVAKGTGHYVHYERPRLVSGRILEVAREAAGRWPSQRHGR
jgi:pimeloyl-ACP methyl ester carboxylesterase